MAQPARISFVSLGCPKALVDSERIITRLRSEGYELARHHDGADLVIVNTCGFLDTAQAESLDAIGQALAENGKVIVTGCMTSGCVRATTVDAFSYGYRTLVPEDCVGDQGAEGHESNLRDVHRRYAEVTIAAEVIAYLERVAAEVAA